MLEGTIVAGLVVGFPVLLLTLVFALDRFESSFVRPGERAANLSELVTSNREPDEVEQVAARLLAPVVPAGERSRTR